MTEQATIEQITEVLVYHCRIGSRTCRECGDLPLGESFAKHQAELIVARGTPAEQRHRFTSGVRVRGLCMAGVGGGELCQQREDHPVHIRDEAPAEQRHCEEKP